jgi:outer membrane protein assembly factor BamB
LGLVALIIIGTGSAIASADQLPVDEQWPQWRGPLGTGVAPSADPPLRWSETEHVQWKSELPGRGHSTPIVWGNRVFVTAAEPIGAPFAPRFSIAPGTHDGVPVTHSHRFWVLALDRESGQIVWRRSVRTSVPHEGGHITGSLASNSAVTDGERVYAFFGSYGLYALDLEGAVQWQADFGLMQSKHGHGEGSSPLLVDELIVVNWDHEGESFLVALDKRTGAQRWKVPRPEETSWASPILVDVQGKRQIVVSGTSRIRAYNPDDGREIWQCGGLSSNVVATPVAGDGIV